MFQLSHPPPCVSLLFKTQNPCLPPSLPPFSPPPFTVDTNSLILLYEPKSSAAAALSSRVRICLHISLMYYREKNVIHKSRNKEGGPPKKNPLLFFRLRICQSRDARIHFTFCLPPGRRTEKREREGKNPYFHIHSAFASTQQHAVIWLGRQSLFLTRKKVGETGERTCRVIQEEYTVGEFLNNGIASPGPVRQTHDLWAITPFLPPHIYIQYNVLPPSCSLLMLTFISVLFFFSLPLLPFGKSVRAVGLCGAKASGRGGENI